MLQMPLALMGGQGCCCCSSSSATMWLLAAPGREFATASEEALAAMSRASSVRLRSRLKSIGIGLLPVSLCISIASSWASSSSRREQSRSDGEA